MEKLPLTSVDDVNVHFAEHKFIQSLVATYKKTADSRRATRLMRDNSREVRREGKALRELAENIASMFPHFDTSALLLQADELEHTDGKVLA